MSHYETSQSGISIRNQNKKLQIWNRSLSAHEILVSKSRKYFYAFSLYLRILFISRKFTNLNVCSVVLLMSKAFSQGKVCNPNNTVHLNFNALLNSLILHQFVWKISLSVSPFFTILNWFGVQIGQSTLLTIPKNSKTIITCCRTFVCPWSTLN